VGRRGVGGRFLCVWGGLMGVSFDGGGTGVGGLDKGLVGEEETYMLVRAWVCGMFSRGEGGRRVGVCWASFAGGGTVGVRDGFCGGERRGR